MQGRLHTLIVTHMDTNTHTHIYYILWYTLCSIVHQNCAVDAICRVVKAFDVQLDFCKQCYTCSVRAFRYSQVGGSSEKIINILHTDMGVWRQRRGAVRQINGI